jgi:hypothetical protein
VNQKNLTKLSSFGVKLLHLVFVRLYFLGKKSMTISGGEQCDITVSSIWGRVGEGGLGSYIVRCVTFPLELVALFWEGWGVGEWELRSLSREHGYTSEC